MSKNFRPRVLVKNVITKLNDVFKPSQTKHEMFRNLEQCHQILLKENMKAALDNSHSFLNRVKFLRHIIEGNTITPLKLGTDAILKLQPPSNKNKTQESFGMLNF